MKNNNSISGATGIANSSTSPALKISKRVSGFNQIQSLKFDNSEHSDSEYQLARYNENSTKKDSTNAKVNLKSYSKSHQKSRQSKSRQTGKIDPNNFKCDKVEMKSVHDEAAEEIRSVKKIKTLTMQGSEIGSACDKSVSSDQNERAPVTIYARQKDGTVTKMEHAPVTMSLSPQIPTIGQTRRISKAATSPTLLENFANSIEDSLDHKIDDGDAMNGMFVGTKKGR